MNVIDKICGKFGISDPDEDEKLALAEEEERERERNQRRAAEQQLGLLLPRRRRGRRVAV